jgi:hypothetical protein
MYKLYKNLYGQDCVTTVNSEIQVSFLADENNKEYQAYLAWLAEGNTPISSDE